MLGDHANIIKHCFMTKHAGVEVRVLFDTAVQTNNAQPIKHENKRNVLRCLTKCLMAFKCYQTRPDTIKLNGTKQFWPNGKMFSHQTMFDGVWSPNISRLERPYRNKLKVSFIGVFLNTRINKTDCTNKKRSQMLVQKGETVIS